MKSRTAYINPNSIGVKYLHGLIKAVLLLCKQWHFFLPKFYENCVKATTPIPLGLKKEIQTSRRIHLKAILGYLVFHIPRHDPTPKASQLKGLVTAYLIQTSGVADQFHFDTAPVCIQILGSGFEIK